MLMIDELITTVAHSTNLPYERASRAVGSMLRFLGARLPSPLFGEVQARLSAPVGAGEAGDLPPESIE